MAEFIPGKTLPAYTRWQADDFGGAPPESKITETPQSAPVAADMANETTSKAAADAASLPFALPTAEEIERMHEEARQSGYQAGYAEGFKAGDEAGQQSGRTAAEVYAANLQGLCQGVEEAMRIFDQEMAEAVLACALEVAGQMTRSVVRVHPEILLSVIRAALAALPLRHGAVTLQVASAEIALAREHLEKQFAQSGWIIQEDPELSPGGCRLRADNSEIDATLETRWRRVLEAIGVTPEWLEQQP
jgi:flagellar assembly protein FliH